VEKAGVLKIQFKELNLKDFDFSINISLNSQENEFSESSSNFFCIFIKILLIIFNNNNFFFKISKSFKKS
jgi:hypothetical protein